MNKKLKQIQEKFIESYGDYGTGYLHHLSRDKHNWLRTILINATLEAYQLGKEERE